MSMKEYVITLEKFSFPGPEKLDDDNANFRLQVDLRYKKANGEYSMKTVIMPSLDSYWECSIKENKKVEEERKHNCFRKRNGELGEFLDELDVCKVKDKDPWGSLFRVNAQCLYELRVTLFDVDRQNWWDKFADALQGVFGKIVGAIPMLGGPIGEVIEEATSSVGRKLANNESKILFTGSARFLSEKHSWYIKGDEYLVQLKATADKTNEGEDHEQQG